jgi:prolipoprotein diacylglyceryltransferase
MTATHQWLILLFGAVTLYGVVILLSAFFDWLLFRTLKNNRKKDTDKNETQNHTRYNS